MISEIGIRNIGLHDTAWVCVCLEKHTFSNFNVDVVGHFELTKGSNCPIALLGPGKQVLVAVRKSFCLHLTGLREIPCLKVNFRTLRNLKNKNKIQDVEFAFDSIALKQFKVCWPQFKLAQYFIQWWHNALSSPYFSHAFFYYT